MPEHGGRLRRIRFGRKVRCGAALSTLIATLALCLAAPEPAAAQSFQRHLGSLEVLWIVSLVGALFFAVFSAIILLRGRRRSEEDIARLERGIADFRASVEQAEALLDTDDQRSIIWHRSDGPPTVVGRLGQLSGAPAKPSAFMAFGTWLVAGSAARLDHALAALRQDGEGFTAHLTTNSDGLIEAVGRTTGGRAIVRFRDLTGDRRAHALLAREHERLSETVNAMRALLDEMPNPCWIRDKTGKLVWVNESYVHAVEAASQVQVINSGAELLDAAARKLLQGHHATDPVFRKRLPVVVAGDRTSFDVLDVDSENGAAGIAIDISELDRTQANLQRTLDFHARTLDELATAVAIFGADRRLQFHNAAFRDLWDLDTVFLESRPEDGALFDTLRQARKLPEQADYRAWKKSTLSAYQQVGAEEHWWHLPDGRTLRVVANPHPQGGATFVFENVTERLDLESRYNALIRVQGETLDNLSEGVAVFGSDGRLRLWNPSLARVWKLSDGRLHDHPHVSQLIGWCRDLHDDMTAWQTLTAAVTGFAETRMPGSGRMERRDGVVVDFSTLPLPDGATLVTFIDVTDTVNVERALVDKNEALQQADQLKNTFIQHISYELRSPLTNIIGFAQLLGDPKFGELNDKQREYTGYIRSSSSALLAIINDILDLATVDAGIMELEVGTVRIRDTVAAVVEGLQDRIREAGIELRTVIPEGIGSLVADEKRLRQILFNLLSNAVAFSDAGGVIEIDCARENGHILFSVRDHGCGIPQEFIANVFDRFVSRSTGAQRRGSGLGLSIVKSFVEAHHGTVRIESVEGEGTTVTCVLPQDQTETKPAPSVGDDVAVDAAATDAEWEPATRAS